MKILIVDDDEDSRMILRKTLESNGHSVDTATNGVEAIKMAKASPPDMIISDILMPEMDGFRLCHEVKQSDLLNKIPFIFYTSTYLDPKDEKLAMDMGASRFILKPRETDEFLDIIRKVSSEHEKNILPVPEKPAKENSELLKMYEQSIVKKLDEKVRELKLYWEIFSNSNDAIAIIDPQGFYIKQNSAHRVLTGYTDEELRGKTPAIHLGEEAFAEMIKKLSLQGVYRGELISRTKDGKTVYIELSAFPVEDEKGGVSCYVSISRDITIRKQTEQRIREESEISSSLLQIVETLNTSLDQKQLMRNVINIIPKYLRFDKVSIFLYEKESGGFVPSVFYGFTPLQEGILLTKTFKKGDIPAIDTVMEGTPVIINNAKECTLLCRELADVFHTGSTAFMPIFTDRGVRGILIGGYSDITTVKSRDISLLKGLADALSVSLQNANLYEALQQLLISTITSFAAILDVKSPWTSGHSERVTQYAISIGTEMGLDKKSLETLKLGGVLHDIGKIGTYDVILDKPDRLTSEEYEVVKRHPVKGASILSPIKQLKEIIPMIKYHHEWIGGGGYPEGLRGDEIPMFARIICVADAYDSMVSDRPYRKAPGKDYAVSELRRCAGRQFDPNVVDAFLRVLSA